MYMVHIEGRKDPVRTNSLWGALNEMSQHPGKLVRLDGLKHHLSMAGTYLIAEDGTPEEIPDL